MNYNMLQLYTDQELSQEAERMRRRIETLNKLARLGKRPAALADTVYADYQKVAAELEKRGAL